MENACCCSLFCVDFLSLNREVSNFSLWASSSVFSLLFSFSFFPLLFSLQLSLSLWVLLRPSFFIYIYIFFFIVPKHFFIFFIFWVRVHYSCVLFYLDFRLSTVVRNHKLWCNLSDKWESQRKAKLSKIWTRSDLVGFKFIYFSIS